MKCETYWLELYAQVGIIAVGAGLGFCVLLGVLLFIKNPLFSFRKKP